MRRTRLSGRPKQTVLMDATNTSIIIRRYRPYRRQVSQSRFITFYTRSAAIPEERSVFAVSNSSETVNKVGKA